MLGGLETLLVYNCYTVGGVGPLAPITLYLRGGEKRAWKPPVPRPYCTYLALVLLRTQSELAVRVTETLEAISNDK